MKFSSGFTLLEILVAITIMTLLMVGAVSFFQDMNRQLAWRKLTEDFQRNFWRENALALTQTSMSSGDLAPTEHHLYFEAGDSDFFPFVLDRLELQQASFPAALITFDSPFSAISFRGLASPWSPAEPFPSTPLCEPNCSLLLTYSRQGSQEMKTIRIDSDKHLEFSF